MTPKPYSEKSSLPADSSDNVLSEIPTEVLPQTPSPASLSGGTTPSPTPQEQVPVETYGDSVVVQESGRVSHLASVTPCYPTPGDIMPYDHSLPDFIRQITNEPNLANLQSLSLRVISTLISLHRMSTYLPNLRELDLEGSVLNSLRDIGCSLKNLQILKVGRCQLESLDGTFGLSSLREFYAQKNFITDVSPCSNLPHIRHVDVSGNRIRNISYAGFLSVCSKLKSIVFTGNPAAEASDYRKHVHRILPQVETLDGIPFVSEDTADEFLQGEENDCEESDIGLAEILDFSSVSPAESLDNLLDLEGNQGFSEQGKTTDNRNINVKQKCISIQKLDKDMENRSKQSSLLMSGNIEEERISSEFPKGPVLEGDPATSSSTSVSVARNNGLRKSLDEESENSGDTVNLEETNCGVRKKRPFPAIPKSKSNDEIQVEDPNQKLNKLTVGLPVCGNLTAALRNRKKIQNAWASQSFLSHELQPQDLPGAGEGLELLGLSIHDGPEKDFSTHRNVPNEEMIEATSRKGRESFGHLEFSNGLKETEELDLGKGKRVSPSTGIKM